MARKLVIRSKYNLLTGEMGQLLPIGLWETLPNEVVDHSTSALVRLSPLAAPVMHPVSARIHHFFIPMRLLWPQQVGGTEGDNWEDFITGGEDGMNAAQIPKITSTGVANDVLDYLGIPPVAGINVNALALHAYNMVYNEWYRDQDLAGERTEKQLDIANIAWEKDYFSSARPWLQKGPEITLPLAGTAPITGLGTQGVPGLNNEVVTETDGSTPTYTRAFATNGAALKVKADDVANRPAIFADLSQALGANINDVRKAFALQRFEENRARWGSRYTEYILKSFRARPADSRLQRPEFLGGGRASINFSEVLQTAPDDAGDPRYGVADLYGHGISAMRGNRYRRTIPEHGYILSLLSVRPKAIYTNGIARHFLKNTKEDFFQPELKYIGQQEVFNNEVFAQSAGGGSTFGYQDRYSEYRHERSTVHGEFRNVLDYWHMGRQFQTPPTLNEDFVKCVPTKRIHNEQTQHALWIMCQHRMRVLSPVGPNSPPKIL
jgi:hypothetical protein